MKLRLALLALALAAPASAQTTQSQFEQAALLLIGPCNRADVAADPAGAVTACDTFITHMLEVKTKIPPVTPHDLNVDRITRGMAEIRIARGYSGQDGGRSERVCAKVEAAWITLAGADPAASPAYADTIRKLVADQASAVAQCRAERGTPEGALPLPS